MSNKIQNFANRFTNRIAYAVILQRSKELHLSSYQIAAAAGVSQGTVSRVLAGKGEPSATNLKSICDVLGLAIADVLEQDTVKMAA